MRGESSSRNVRSRHTPDLETSVDRNNLPRTSGIDSHPAHHNVSILAQVHSLVSHLTGSFPSPWRYANSLEIQMLLSTFINHIDSYLADISGFSPETINFLPSRIVVNSTPVDTSGYHQGLIGNRNSTATHCLSREI
ncbi:unnamed protein product [Eruca vesicaria subsp. sativa]|uniref:Uncharacterized protein n=1 Tax=Eruca vesicaria subsp. sativa TaxID=29727 RepID=A0ABC8J118_ERUVS|nr:unnamed protein product [Eruca vesicaria subsp. sativa]